MKRMCQGSVCLTCIRAAVAAALVLPTLSSCLREWDRKREPLLTAPGEVEFDGYVAVLEEFKDTYIFDAVAFGQDGIGYGVAAVYPLYGDDNPYKTLLLKTEDGGRTWQPTGKRMNGRCSKMHLLDGNLYLLMRRYEPQMSAILKCDPQDGFKLEQLSRFGENTGVYELHVLNDSTFACGMNFSKHRADGRLSLSDSVMVTRDSGRTWKALSLPWRFAGYHYLAFDGERVFAVLSDGIGGWPLLVKDIMTGEERELLDSNIEYFAVSGNMIAMSRRTIMSSRIIFWRYDRGGIQRLSTFDWKPRRVDYTPKYLHKEENLVICIGSQFSWRGEDTSCAFASVDGGKHWQALVMGNKIHGPMATTSTSCRTGESDSSISVFFTLSNGPRRGYKHCILTLKKKQNPVQSAIGLTDTK